MRICKWKIPRGGEVGKWHSNLWLGRQLQRAREARSESAETMSKQKQRGRCTTGGLEAEKKRHSRRQCGGAQTRAAGGRSENPIPKAGSASLSTWTPFCGLEEAGPHGPDCLAYPHNRPVIFEITEGVCFFPQASLTSRKVIRSHSGGWGGAGGIPLEEMELAGPDRTWMDRGRTFQAETTTWLKGMCEERKRVGGHHSRVRKRLVSTSRLAPVVSYVVRVLKTNREGQTEAEDNRDLL